MNKQKFYSALYVILIISLIAFMIWIVMFMRGSAKECLTNPVKYFEDKNEGASCSCMKDGKFYKFREDTTESYLSNEDLNIIVKP